MQMDDSARTIFHIKTKIGKAVGFEDCLIYFSPSYSPSFLSVSFLSLSFLPLSSPN